jgi:hypothetical protein
MTGRAKRVRAVSFKAKQVIREFAKGFFSPCKTKTQANEG